MLKRVGLFITGVSFLATGSCLAGGMVADRPLLALLIDVEPSSSELAASSMAVGWKLPIILEGDGLEAGAAARGGGWLAGFAPKPPPSESSSSSSSSSSKSSSKSSSS